MTVQPQEPALDADNAPDTRAGKITTPDIPLDHLTVTPDEDGGDPT